MRLFPLAAPFRFVLDIVFPPSPLALKLRSMDAEAFLAAIPPSFSVASCSILSRYKDPLIHEAVWQMKFRGDTHATMLLAEGIYRLIMRTIATDSQLVLIPVPASKKRIRMRGFDQCRNLARHIDKIAKRNGSEMQIVLDALRKTKSTPEQKSQNRADRLANLRDSFEIAPGFAAMIRDKEVILIDDVLTTGATLHECARALQSAGASKVHAFAAAH